MKKKLEFITKPITYEQRIDCNDMSTEFTPGGGVITRDIFAQRAKYIKYGLKSLEGIEITEDNFKNKFMELSNDEITIISDQIANESNFPKKK